ncbi:hypothetical protein C8J57DRAFT_1396095 [Mycena rebaudengoi]|nr:hypothetical protein C8J57DRAFT_1396095 [Mycena rebaudengoi]
MGTHGSYCASAKIVGGYGTSPIRYKLCRCGPSPPPHFSMLSVQSSVTHLPPSLLRDDATINESDQRRDEISGNEKTSDSQRRSPQIGREAEPSSDPQTCRYGRGTFASKLWGPAGIVILGQLILQTAAWGFFAVIWRRGLISVPSFNFDVVDSFQLIHSACTQISTGLAGCSSFLFSWAIQQSITLHLRRERMTFATFFWSMQISSRSRIWELKHLKWTVLSIAVVALAGAQTSGWSALLTPELFYHKTRVTGREFYLSSSLLQPMLSSGALDFCVFNSTYLVALSVGRTGNGYAALNGDEGFPTSLTLLDNAFNTSTGGILPLAFGDLDANPWFGNMTTLPKALSAPPVGFHNGLSWKSSINQQGFTADVSCKMQDLKPDTTPSITITTINGTQSSPAVVNMTSNCEVPLVPDGTQLNVASTMTNQSDYLLMIACGPGVSAEGYTLIFVGSGLYDFVKTTVCTFAPKITNVWADYSYEQISDTITTTTLPGGIPDIKGPAAISAVMTIHNMLSFSQAVATNIVASDQSDIMFAMEYIRGVTEYSGTVFRACVSVKNGTFLDGVPKNMTIPIQGTLHTQFYGWPFTASTSWLLVPGTIIAIGSIWVLLLTVARHAGDLEGRKFNPADTMQLVAAAAAGGLKNVFHGTDEDAITKAENARIAIGAFQDQELALIVKRP